MIEPAVFLAVAFFAGHTRLIHYFPEATKGGLLLTGAAAGLACSLHDYKFEGENFSFVKKLSAIGIASVMSYIVTDTLKGRVALSFIDNLKILVSGATICLIKNMREYALPENPLPPPPVNKEMEAIEGITPKIRIKAGKTNCKNYRTSTQGPPDTITLKDHVYEVTHKNGSPALLMTQKDFNTLQGICHGGAFGSDYCTVKAGDLTQYGFKGVEGKNYSFLWKIPADLKGIDNYVVDKSKKYTTADVGKYRLAADTQPSAGKISPQNLAILKELQTQSGTKIRSDFSETRPPLSSTHYIRANVDVPGISTCFFFQNFNAPQLQEWDRVQGLLDKLAEKDIGAYLCNSQQHMILIGAYKGAKITPERVSTAI
ncbi:MAG: hypothetical protein KDK69_02630 [Chlamydiia bacterium]|nr:hypothetical protein [Chlamydiia bacterium]